MNPFEGYKYARPLGDSVFTEEEAAKYNYEETKKKLAQLDELERKRIAEIRAAKSDYSKITGKKIYISVDGDDNNDGLSENTPVKTLKKGNSLAVYGDGVLLKRGDMWRGEYIVAKSGVTYSAYGDGDKPFINISPEDGADENKWTLIYENKETGALVWKFSNENMLDVGVIVINGGEGIAKKVVPFFNGHFYDRSDEEKKPFTYKNLKNMEFFHKADSVMSGKTKINATFARGPVFLRCDEGNPGKLFNNIEFCERVRNIMVYEGTRDVVIDNLCLKYSGFYGISLNFQVDNIRMQNLEIGWIGGGITDYGRLSGRPDVPVRLGNGIEIYGGCDGFYIDNCYVYQCYDAGITHQVSPEKRQRRHDNVEYTNNVLTDCVYSIEYFLHCNKDYTEGREGVNIIYENNLCRRAGWGFGSLRPDVNCERHLRSWNEPYGNLYSNFVIKNNIFDRATQEIAQSRAASEKYSPIYDGNTFIQGLGNALYHHGGQEKLKKQNMDENAVANVRDELCDKNAELYYVPHIPKWEFCYRADKKIPVSEEEYAKMREYLASDNKWDTEICFEKEVVKLESETEEITPYLTLKTFTQENAEDNIFNGLVQNFEKDEKTGISYTRLVPDKTGLDTIDCMKIPQFPIPDGQHYFKILMRSNDKAKHSPSVCIAIPIKKDGTKYVSTILGVIIAQTPVCNGEWEEIIIQMYGYREDTFAFGNRIFLSPFGEDVYGPHFYKGEEPIQSDLYFDLAAIAVFDNLASAKAADLIKELKK